MEPELARSRPAEFWYLPVWSLWRREVVRFLRQRSRIIGALGTPIVFWVLIGSGLANSFRHPAGDSEPGVSYLEYSYPGMMALIVLFTAVFAMISVIEDRREGFMQAVLAAPVARSAIVTGKILGSTTLVLAQAIVFLLLAYEAGIELTASSLAATVFVLAVLGAGLSAMGFAIAWLMDSTQGFHAVMNLFLVPLWLLSGALFPPGGASRWLAWVMAANPLAYGVTALRQALYFDSGADASPGPGFVINVLISIAFTGLMVYLATRIVNAKQ